MFGRGEFDEVLRAAGILGDDEEHDAARTQDEGKQRETQAAALVRLAQDAELFHDPEGQAWATVPVGGHRETWPVRGKGFRTWLARRFYDEADKPPGAQALQDALNVIEARALFDGRELAVYVRAAEHEGHVYLDLGDPSWRAVEVDALGWRVVEEPPVKFWRPRGLLALPEPVPGGSLEELRQFANLPDAESFVLAVAWLVGALKPRGPYAILDVEGEQGSGKSTLCRMLRALIDPHAVALRRPPREERDLFIAASNAWAVGFDNLSGLPDWLSDALCVLATGGGFATRELYSDREETLLDAQRPVLVNGIDQIGRRGDFRDRCLRVVLPRLNEDATRDEATLWQAFEATRPRLLGALLDAVSAALRCWREVRFARTPRMADFARWMAAAELGGALPWEPGTFLRVYLDQRDAVAREALEGDALAAALLALLDGRDRWEGTAAELLAELNAQMDEATRRQKTWPQSPRALAGRLRRLAPDLRRAAGVEVGFSREGHQRTRLVLLERMRNEPSAPSAPSSAYSHKGFGADANADGTTPAGDFASAYRPQFARPESLAAVGEWGTADDADDADDDFPTHPTCPACGGRTWWPSVHGALVCARCHPPVAPELVADVEEVEP